jgi:hypothetical protein
VDYAIWRRQVQRRAGRCRPLEIDLVDERSPVRAPLPPVDDARAATIGKIGDDAAVPPRCGNPPLRVRFGAERLHLIATAHPFGDRSSVIARPISRRRR